MRDLRIPYTKLSGDAIWNNVSKQYMFPEGRYYHNMEHVISMYGYAKELGLNYDINLDVSILIHDMVYDGKLQVEIRSVESFVQMVKNVTKQTNMISLPEKVFMPFGVVSPTEIADHVFKTINHKPEKDKDNRLILLDLYSFAKGRTVIDKNYNNLLKELKILYPDTEVNVIKVNMVENLIRICTNLIEFTVSNEDDVFYDKWIEIQKGMEYQINMIIKELENDKKLER